MSEPTPKPKKPISDKQLAANRNNALKSTGPKDTSISRFNACTHGMRAEHAVLPGESEEAYNERRAQWLAEFDPKSDRVRYLVERLVLQSWRMDRGAAAEQALGIRNRIKIIEGEEHRQAKAVEKLTARLEKDPGAIREIRRIPAGARWVREQYLVLRRHLESNPCLLSTQRNLLYRHGIHRLTTPLRQATSLSLDAPEWVSSEDPFGGSSWDGSVNGPHRRCPNETASLPVT